MEDGRQRDAAQRESESMGLIAEGPLFSEQLPEEFAAYLKRNKVDVSCYDTQAEIPRYFAVLYPVPALTRAAAAVVEENLRKSDGDSAPLVKLLFSSVGHARGHLSADSSRTCPDAFVSDVRVPDCVFHSLDVSHQSDGVPTPEADGGRFTEDGTLQRLKFRYKSLFPPYEQYLKELLSCMQKEFGLASPPSPVPWLLPNCFGRAEKSSVSENSSGPPSFPIVFSLPSSVSPRNCTPYRLGLIHPLDAASVACAQSLRPARGDLVCDLCCAPGNKLLLLASAVAGPPPHCDACTTDSERYSEEAAGAVVGARTLPLADSERPTGLAAPTLWLAGSESALASAGRGGIVVGVEGRRQRVEVCRRIVRRAGARNVILVLQDGRLFTGACRCALVPEGESSSCQSLSASALHASTLGRTEAAVNARATGSNKRVEQPMRQTRSKRGGRLSRRKARKRDEAAEVPLIDLLPGLENFVDTDVVISSHSPAAAPPAGGEAPKPCPAVSNQEGRLECSKGETSNHNCFGKFDKVLVDVECTHDGSIRHMQKFGRQWRWNDFKKKMQMSTSEQESFECRATLDCTAGAPCDGSQSVDQGPSPSHNTTSESPNVETQKLPPLKRGRETAGVSKEATSVMERPLSPPACSPEDFSSLRQRQRQLLQRGFELLRPGGLLVYSTCSKCEDQNEHVVSDFLRSNENAALYPLPCRILRNGASRDVLHLKTATTLQPPGSVEELRRTVNEPECAEWPATPSSLFLDRTLKRHPAAFCSEMTSVLAPCERTAGGGEPNEEQCCCPLNGRGCEAGVDCAAVEQGSGDHSGCSRPYHPCSCYFGPEQSGTSGLFLACITKLPDPS
ncbi:hypothetical protein BESB_056320 [Besnoitia besnoiti]|uniref:SAM-dependent MTase RsmB/NOP-type domain-containing protein n=1 Tax=Besnoitia besnoiti TaxID=94643 RepID=A0A2A9MI98_BESBE|nr:hypothetical protein BESB_056320 [Besnoitia besnoiti]PFH35981.1 hypothetical protein BESB_056320 [Besnoitia besnoiti]